MAFCVLIPDYSTWAGGLRNHESLIWTVSLNCLVFTSGLYSNMNNL